MSFIQRVLLRNFYLKQAMTATTPQTMVYSIPVIGSGALLKMVAPTLA